MGADSLKALYATAASERRLRAIIELEPECVKLVDRSGQLLEMNPAGLAMLEADSLAEAKKQGLMDFVLPAHREAFGALHRQVMEGGTGTLTFEVIGLRGGRRWLETHAAPMRNADGEVEALLGITRDVTARREAEAARLELERKLHQSQKMESLGNLAGGVAHDMNNVLAAILGLASLRLDGPQDEEADRHAFEMIERACFRGSELVKGLLSFSRKGLAETTAVDVNSLVREEVNFLRHTTLARIELRMDLSTGLPAILGDPSALSHALMNLCINATDAMPEGGVLTIRTGTRDSMVFLEVRDTGLGMSEETLAKALDPFFTTKAPGKGTGLGLSIVHSTVAAHQGDMRLESQPGRGTSVLLCFPILEGPPPMVGATRRRPSYSQVLAFQVLVVDDEEAVRSTLEAMLTYLGCEVVICESAEQALTMLEAGLDPNLVILDINMPGLGGVRALPRIRALRPELSIILSTGKMDQEALDRANFIPGISLLPKPYSLSNLRQALTDLREPEAPPSSEGAEPS